MTQWGRVSLHTCVVGVIWHGWDHPPPPRSLTLSAYQSDPSQPDEDYSFRL
ncbi:MAG: hypothetical protein K8L99_08475 [Anaerolineae bacterium]|nr:hypothetical protein [Anaerolineae bacterium]